MGEEIYTKLSKYTISIIEDEVGRCKQLEEGLREEICMLVTASAEWNEFSKLVEAAMREEKSVVERNQEKKTVNGISGSKSPSPSTD